MKCIVCFVCFLSVFVAVTNAFPAGIESSGGLQVSSSTESADTTSNGSGGGGGGGLSNVLSNIDLPGLLRGVNAFVKLIGQFCPPLSQVLDNVIQNVTSTAFRIFGRLILQNGGLGGGNSGGGGGGQRVNVVLPTFPPDDDEDYDEDDDQESSSVASVTNGANGLSLPTSTNAPSTLFTSAASEDNSIAKRHVRVTRDAQEEEEEEEDQDQDGAESAPEPAQDLSDVDVDTDRNKRFLPFGGSADGHGSTGGSGNFLFDIIRNTADRAARTVGTVYRMVAGTENLGWGLTATADSSKTLAPSAAPLAKLVAGSGATEAGDEKANAPGGVAEVDVGGKADGYTEGIPGPITRLFVIANRGIANLVQDLILRLAQTSERLVNFKARLVTSLI